MSQQIQVELERLRRQISTLGGSTGADISLLEAAVDDLESDVSTLQATVASEATQLDTAQSDITSLSSTVGGHTTTLSDHESRITQNETDIAALGDTSAIEADIDALEAAMTTAQSDIDAAEATIIAEQALLDTAQSDISTLQSTVSAEQALLDTAQADITALQTEVDAVHTTATFTPTLGGITLGSGGTNEARYHFVGDGPDVSDRGLLWIGGRIILGTSPTVGSGPTITLPSGFELAPIANTQNIAPISSVKYSTGGVGGNLGYFRWNSTTTLTFMVNDASTTYLSAALVTATVPVTWAAGGTFYYQVLAPVIRV